MTAKHHWETHLYTYAVAYQQRERIAPANLAGMRAKAIMHGHTEGECLRVEQNPRLFIQTGQLSPA